MEVNSNVCNNKQDDDLKSSKMKPKQEKLTTTA
jgi:hypothetical protein